jgi:hypothetical protein
MFIQQVKMFGEFCFVLGKFDTNFALPCLSLNAIAVISSFYSHPSTFINKKHSSSIIMPDLFIRGQGWLQTMYSLLAASRQLNYYIVADSVFILFIFVATTQPPQPILNNILSKKQEGRKD